MPETRWVKIPVTEYQSLIANWAQSRMTKDFPRDLDVLPDAHTIEGVLCLWPQRQIVKVFRHYINLWVDESEMIDFWWVKIPNQQRGNIRRSAEALLRKIDEIEVFDK